MKEKLAILYINYYEFIIIPESVSAQAIIDIMKSKVYKKVYDKPTAEQVDNAPNVEFIESSSIQSDEPKIIEMQRILEENNRLSRECDSLKEKLENALKENSDSKEISIN
jgi:hypothetical protein